MNTGKKIGDFQQQAHKLMVKYYMRSPVDLEAAIATALEAKDAEIEHWKWEAEQQKQLKLDRIQERDTLRAEVERLKGEISKRYTSGQADRANVLRLYQINGWLCDLCIVLGALLALSWAVILWFWF